MQDVIAADGQVAYYTDQVHSDCPVLTLECTKSLDAASGKWITLKLQADRIRYPDPNDNYSLGLYGVEAGDWFDIRELGVYPGWLP